MRKPKPIIDRDLGTKKQCIAALRRAINLATQALDNGMLFTALTYLQSEMTEISKKLPPEKIVKPFKK